MALTDPARELAMTLELIGAPPNAALDTRIAQGARVGEWSADFFRIIFELLNRFELLDKEINHLALDDDIRTDALNSLNRMKGVFTQKGMLNQSTDNVRPIITGPNPTILKMLSPQIRERISYPLLSDSEREEILSGVRELIGWLEQIQSEEKDFIREALVAGLREFEFRLDRLQWFGSGYPIEALRDVLQAYMALQGAQMHSADGQELMDAILTKTKALLVKVLSALDVAKDTTEKADWALRAYGAVSAITQGSAQISGLLS